jgi:hypothetical protein
MLLAKAVRLEKIDEKKKIKSTRVFIEIEKKKTKEKKLNEREKKEKQVFEVEKGNVGPAPHVYTN